MAEIPLPEKQYGSTDWWKGENPWWESTDSDIISNFSSESGEIDWESIETVRSFRDISPGSNSRPETNIYGDPVYKDGEWNHQDDRARFHSEWMDVKDMQNIGGPNSSVKAPKIGLRQDKYSDLNAGWYNDADDSINQKAYGTDIRRAPLEDKFIESVQ